MPTAEAETRTRGGRSSAPSVLASRRRLPARLSTSRARRAGVQRPPAKLAPARWTAASSPSSGSRAMTPAAGSHLSWAPGVPPGRGRRSRRSTAQPAAASAGASAEPIMPLAPVTSTRLGLTPASFPLRAGHERLQELDRNREDGGRVVLGRDLGERLQVAQLHRRGLAPDDRRGLGEARRRLVLALGVDDFGAALALGLGLARDGALHLLGQVDVLDLDLADLDP